MTGPGAGPDPVDDPLRALRPDAEAAPWTTRDLRPSAATPVHPDVEAGVDPGLDHGDGSGSAVGSPGDGSGTGLGALRDTHTIVASVISGAGRTAERASGLASRVSDDRNRMVVALGGGPPREVREAAARNQEAVGALDQASVALHEAAAALRSFVRRTS